MSIVVPQCEISPIQARFEDALSIELEEKNKDTKRYPISPSAILACARQTNYKLQNYAKPGTIPSDNWSLRQLLVFDNGHRTEKRVFDQLAKTKNLKVIEDKERKLLCKLDDQEITFEIDRHLIDEQTGKKYIADCKAVAEKTFKTIIDTRTPKDSHYVQVQLYLSSEWAQQGGISRGLLYYECKNTQQYILLEFGFDPEIAKYGYSRAFESFSSFKRNDYVPREFLKGYDWQCNPLYCSFYKYCYSYYLTKNEKEIELDVLDIRLENAATEKEMLEALLAYGDFTTYKYLPKHEIYKVYLKKGANPKEKDRLCVECETKKFSSPLKRGGRKSSKSLKDN